MGFVTTDGLSIAEAATRTDLSTHTLRYYERAGLMLGIGRSGAGHRRYTERDIAWAELIARLRAMGIPIREIRRFTELVRDGVVSEDDRLRLLSGQRDRLRREISELHAHLVTVERKIDFHLGLADSCDLPESMLRGH